MERIFIKPVEGKAVRLDNGMMLPVEGAEVIRTSYVDRRILAEDVRIVEAVAEVKNSKKEDGR